MPTRIYKSDLERACKAHWPSWDRMRKDHQEKWRIKMIAALNQIGCIIVD